jgi:hypothetical protein
MLNLDSARFQRVKFKYDEPLSSYAFNRPVSVYRSPHRALTLCPQLCMGIPPRRYTEIGLLHGAPLPPGGGDEPGPSSGGQHAVEPGKAVQVDPMKPTLKAPETKPLNLQYDEPLSIFAFNFNLRRYSQVSASALANSTSMMKPKCAESDSRHKVERRRLTLPNPG